METNTSGRQVPWNNRDVWWGLLMGIGGYVVIPIGLIWLAFLFFSRLAGYIFVSLSIPIGSLLFLIPIWFFTRRKYGTGLSELGFRKFTGGSLGIGCGMMAAAYVCTGIYVSIITTVFDSETQPDLAPLGEQLVLPWILPMSVIMIAPLVEETFFRGFVFAGFRNRYGWKKAALLSAFIFGAIHLQPLAFPYLFGLGLLFAYLYNYSGSLWLPIIMHFLLNSWAIIGEYLIASD